MTKVGCGWQKGNAGVATLIRTCPPRTMPICRWFPAGDVSAHEAKYLDVILYSREQIVKETADLPSGQHEIPDVPWGIISIKAQDEDHETPMQVGTHGVGHGKPADCRGSGIGPSRLPSPS